MQKGSKHSAKTLAKMSGSIKDLWSKIPVSERKRRLAKAHAALMKKHVEEAFR